MLHGVSSDAVLGEGAAAERDGGAADRELRGAGTRTVRGAAWQHVRMQVAVGEMAPHGVVELVRVEDVADLGQQLRDPIERDDHVAARLRQRRLDRALRRRDATIDRLRDALAKGEERVASPVLAGQRRQRRCQHVVVLEQSAEAEKRGVVGWIADAADFGGRLIRGRGRFEIDLHEQRGAYGRVECEPEAVRVPVLADERDRARIEVLDGRHVDAAAEVATRFRSGLTERIGEPECRGFGGTPDQRDEGRGRRWEHVEVDAGHDAERAFGPDEEIDEVHRRGREVAGRQLRNAGHAVRRDRDAAEGSVAPDDLEMTVAAGGDFAADEIQHTTVVQHDGEATDPGPCRSMLERGRTSGVGGDGAADGGAVVGRHRRIASSTGGERGGEVGQHDARADHDVVGCRSVDRREARGRQDRFSLRGRAAGERGLRADDQHVGCVGEDRCDGRFTLREPDHRRMAAGDVRGVGAKAREAVRIRRVRDRPRRATRRPAPRLPMRPGAHRSRAASYEAAAASICRRISVRPARAPIKRVWDSSACVARLSTPPRSGRAAGCFSSGVVTGWRNPGS